MDCLGQIYESSRPNQLMLYMLEIFSSKLQKRHYKSDSRSMERYAVLQFIVIAMVSAKGTAQCALSFLPIDEYQIDAYLM